MKIIDCFTFYNEMDLLNYRLNILKDVVDYFVIVEATHTHVGKPKPLFFAENRDQFDFIKDKIIHIVVNDFKYIGNIDIKRGEQWLNEGHQRNCIARGLIKLDLDDTDIFTICDLDEIPNPAILTKIRSGELKIDRQTLLMDFYYYNLNSRISAEWPLAKIIRYGTYKNLDQSCNNIRRSKCNTILAGGWHLSYFGTVAFIKNKIENFAHQEFNTESITDMGSIMSKIMDNKDLYNREHISIISIPINDNPNPPPKCRDYLGDYILF